MLKKSRLLVMTAIAMLAVALAATSASAASFRIEPGGRIRATSAGKLTFGAGETAIECEVTLEGSLRNTLLNKVAGTVFGEVTAVRIDNPRCTGGTVSAVLGLNWRMTYSSITGTLPERVTAISFDLGTVGFRLSGFLGVECLYGGTVRGNSIAVTGANPYTAGRIRAGTNQLPRVSGSIFCPREGSMNGSFNLEPTQRITRL